MTFLIAAQKSPLARAMYSIATKKSAPKDWAFLYVRVDETVQNFPATEILKSIKGKVSDQAMEVFKFEDEGEMLLVADNKMHQSLTFFNKLVNDRFGHGGFKLQAGDLSEAGLGYLSKMLGRHIAPDDIQHTIGLKRMTRVANSIIVLDDDPMMRKTMEFSLKGFGFVHAVASYQEFVPAYKEYAPNIAFVDIHLKSSTGPEVVKAIRAEIDPDMHAVMMSADTTADTILSIKNCKANGFIVKPFTRDIVYQHLLKAPTFVSKIL